MIKKFSCKNFRNLDFDDLDLGYKINVLIGANNSGKSNFIKAISFLANMLISGDSNAFESAFLHECSRNGWGRQINRLLDLPNTVDFKWNVELEKEPINYYLSFVGGQNTEDFHIVRETMECADIPPHESRHFNYFKCHSPNSGKGYFSTARQKGGKNRRIPIKISNRDSVLLQFKDKLLEEKELYNDADITDKVRPIVDEISTYFKKFCSYSSAQFDLNKLRQSVDVKSAGLRLAENASNFLNVLNVLSSKDIYSNRIFDEKFRELIHGFDLSRVISELDKLTMKLGYNNTQFDLTDVSDGTLKALVLNLIINMPINNGISMLAIDEPELNLHPAWQKIVAHWILTSSTIKQCFISTHSPDFLDAFTEDFMEDRIALYVFSLGGNIQKVCYNDIKSELDGWQLGDLYRAGEPLLGGWPW